MRDVGLCFCLSLSLPLEAKARLKVCHRKAISALRGPQARLYPRFALYGCATYASLLFCNFCKCVFVVSVEQDGLCPSRASERIEVPCSAEDCAWHTALVCFPWWAGALGY